MASDDLVFVPDPIAVFFQVVAQRLEEVFVLPYSHPFAHWTDLPLVAIVKHVV